ncbi:LEAF RUST 10 DISEASE-RESISTANCE LOCUS RECEPTOR-LIKE PROTEIN KINASE-like 1.1 [Senna tora]|uniref:LEAF RUST 10 DISEASE-RESISTANCE LOCUS RECEPTOR-LIKE PROTEIN KINASE-like 1.1 n=1 Tax=Senna tora TaxID=362788 RepID=A0A834SQW0_9FABA|nr:LEAF RUST 10 DISEASE-RESISTANCE LOCUS RECEPTOR-LIKE PROTEIN KINASE-like 1.1 [Senna tora]
MSFQIIDNITLFRCSNHNNNLKNNSTVPKFHFSRYNCPGFDLYFDDPHRKNDTTDHKSPPTSLSACSVIQLPLNTQPNASSTFNASDPFTFLTAEIRIEVALSEPCYVCYYLRGGRCRLEGELCSVHEGSGESTTPGYKILSGTATAAGSIVTMLFVLFFILHLKEQRYNWSGFLNQSRSVYFDIDPYTNPECQDVDYGVPVFSYEDLERATNSFDQSRELGSGGFGNVYYGKLEDAREVAIKRLYDHKRDSKRVKQFMNEIQILTRLRHRNLVSLYGCTSHSSQRLLQVYEYIPNGTLASHLANPGSLPWPVRMKIAIETASALTYLHASGIIHRDVKTNNILLDDNFCVKVGDFGISRLSPSGVTHVTTAPQGTMGYVDPEYQENCHLTDKSDVYSFGVVLIELISSLPAIDFERINVHEIKLANLAMNKVRGRAFSELVDPSLGFESDKDQSGN